MGNELGGRIPITMDPELKGEIPNQELKNGIYIEDLIVSRIDTIGVELESLMFQADSFEKLLDVFFIDLENSLSQLESIRGRSHKEGITNFKIASKPAISCRYVKEAILEDEKFLLMLDSLLNYGELHPDCKIAFYNTLKENSKKSKNINYYISDLEETGVLLMEFGIQKHSRNSDIQEAMRNLLDKLVKNFGLAFERISVQNKILDRLTNDKYGFKSKVSFDEKINELLESHNHFSIFVFDIANFSSLLEIGGSQIEETLCRDIIGNKVPQYVGNTGKIYRLGGAKHAVIFEGTSAQEIEMISQGIISSLGNERFFKKGTRQVGTLFIHGGIFKKVPNRKLTLGDIEESMDTLIAVSREESTPVIIKDSLNVCPENIGKAFIDIISCHGDHEIVDHFSYGLGHMLYERNKRIATAGFELDKVEQIFEKMSDNGFLDLEELKKKGLSISEITNMTRTDYSEVVVKQITPKDIENLGLINKKRL